MAGRSKNLPLFGALLVRLLVPSRFRREILGDLEEGYRDRRKAEGGLKAGLWFWGQVARIQPLELRRLGPVEWRRVTTNEGTTWGDRVDTVMRDLRLAVRRAIRRPGLALTVVATVAVAVGATTAVFSVVNGVLLKPLDYPDSHRLVRAWQTQPEWIDHPNAQFRHFGLQFPLSVPTFLDWQERQSTFSELGMYTNGRWVRETAEGAEVVYGMLSTSGVFSSLDVPAAQGRWILPEDDQVGAPLVVVVSHDFWSNKLGAAPDAVGSTMTLDGQPYTIVGVMPAGFSVSGSGDGVWASLPESEWGDDRTSQSYTALGRLRDGVTVADAETDLVSIQAELSRIYPDEQGNRSASIKTLLDSEVGDVRATLLLLLGAVGLVLAIACVNIANMLSVNGLARRGELAVKSALGAAPSRLVKGQLWESGLLATVGGAGGIMAAYLILPALVSVLPGALPRSDSIGVDGTVLVFGLGVTVMTALVVGALPGLGAAAVEPKQLMSLGGRGAVGTGGRGRAMLVIAEVALAFVLLTGAGLLASSFHKLWTEDRGFDTEGLYVLRIMEDPTGERTAEEVRQTREAIHARLNALPGVAASASNQVPLSGSSSSSSFFPSQPAVEGEEINFMLSVVDPSYFDVLGVPLLEGRLPLPSDGPDDAKVAVINQAGAEFQWPGESAVGKRVWPGKPGEAVEIVGVVANVRHLALAEPPQPKLYVPMLQNHRNTESWLVRASGESEAVISMVRAAVNEVSPSTPVRGVTVLEDRISNSVSVPRFRTFVVIGLAGVATVLALLGVYGVIAFAVSQRLKEMAVRMAIGADPTAVLNATLGRGLKMCAAGVAVGVVLLWSISGAVEGFLYEVDVLNPILIGAGIVSVALVGLAASYLPARKGAGVDLVSVLKAE